MSEGNEDVNAGGSSEKSMRRSSSGTGADREERGGSDRGKLDRVGLRIVVMRVRLVVSSEGGGGREASTDSMMEAFHRKHSPLPK